MFRKFIRSLSTRPSKQMDKRTRDYFDFFTHYVDRR